MPITEHYNNVAAAAQFVDTPPKTPEPDRMTKRVEHAIFAAPFPKVVELIETMPLDQAIDPNCPLPFVTGMRDLTPGEFGPVGSRRVVYLSDGSTLLEQVISKESTDAFHRFRYQVWNYTSEQAKPVDYAVGEFIYEPTESHDTRVRWTYAFALKPDRFPGNLGPVGRFLFRTNFLDGPYATMMRGTLARMKENVENAAYEEFDSN